MSRRPQTNRAVQYLAWEADLSVSAIAARYGSTSSFISRVLAGADPFPQRLVDILVDEVGHERTARVQQLAAETAKENAARKRLTEVAS